MVPDATVPLLKRTKHLRLVWTSWQNPRKKEITEEKKSEIKKRNPVLADSKYRSHFSTWGFVVQWELQGSWDPLGTCHRKDRKQRSSSALCISGFPTDFLFNLSFKDFA